MFLYVDDNAAEERALLESPLWLGLEPVQAGRVFEVNSGVWNSIDIIGAMRVLDDIEQTLIAAAEAEQG